MKAIRRLHPSLRYALAGAVLLALGSCAATPPPAPAPQPVATKPPPRIMAPPPAPRVHWRDAAITPGDWRWSDAGGVSSARFGDGLFELRCERASGSVVLSRSGAAAGPVAATIHTTTQRRTVTAQPYAGPPQVLAITLAAHDDLLDAMAFSRGRFAVEMAGVAPLYLPSWPEVSRVLEDCRQGV